MLVTLNTNDATKGYGSPIAFGSQISVPAGNYFSTDIIAITGYTVSSITMNGVNSPLSPIGNSIWQIGFAVLQDTAIVVNFSPVATNIIFNIVSAGNGTVSPTGTIIVAQDSIQAFTATPAYGYVFDHWELIPLGGTPNPDLYKQNPASVKMVSAYDNATLTAYFSVPSSEPLPSAIPLILGLVAVGMGLIGYVWWKAFHD